MHVVVVLALEGVVGFDLAIPCQVFASVRTPDGGQPYEVRVCGPRSATATAVRRDLFDVRPRYRFTEIANADTVVVPGIADLRRPASPPVLTGLRAAADRGVRIASICTGSFVLAAAGLLDGRQATTHWREVEHLARRHPAIDVHPTALFLDEGQVLTAGGVAAGLDLCLHLVRNDHGSAVAAQAARMLLMAPHRDGAQDQFVAQPIPDTDWLQPTLQWLQRNVHRSLTTSEIAQHARTSVRSLHRKFQEQTGTTPMRWLLRARLHRAQELLETTDLGVERVAELSGFGTSATLRWHFSRRVGGSPLEYRRSFRDGS